MTIKVLDTEDLWLQERTRHITGTDAAKLLGLSKFGDPFTVWLEKTGQAPKKEPSRKMIAGTRYQQAILDDYALETGHVVQHVGANALYIGAGGLLAASLDGLDQTLGYAPVDAKNVGYTAKDEGWGEEGTDQIPPDYRCQLAAQMAVTGAKLSRLAVLVGGWELKIYQMDRDLKLEEMILEAAGKFWREHVLTKIPPALGASEEAAEYLKAKYPVHTKGAVMESLPDDLPWRDYFKQAKEDAKDAERREEEAKNWFKARLQRHEAMFFPDGKKLTWKNIANIKKTDWEGAFLEATAHRTDQQALIEKFTSETPGARRFLAS